VEVFERENDLVVRADLPGVNKEDLRVEFQNGVPTIQGERRHETEDSREGRYVSERAYGTFLRTIPLPDGIQSDNVQASFRDGVLEIVARIPEETRGRRIEIQG
jgi:HSP20 family protein